MATEGNVRVPADSTGKRVDAASLDDGGVSVYRQKTVISGASGSAEVAVVANSAPAAGAFGLVVRHAGNVDVNAHTISGTVALAAGAANIGTINNISAAVVLAAGTANIGSINNISAAVVLAAGANNIGSINNISAAVVLAAGANNIGSVNGISATVTAAITRMHAAPAVQSASRGPRCVNLSASANATIIAAPGAGMAIYITSIMVSNASGTNSKARIGTSATAANVTMMMAASGGGFTSNYVPPWKLSTNEALVGSVKPSVSEAICNVHFFVASADAL
jgi:hypothetical protein